MRESRKQKWVLFLDELSFYPDRNLSENLVRGLCWIASLGIGILCSQDFSRVEMGGACFVFSISWLLEFYNQERKDKNADRIHGILVIVILVLLIISLFMIFGKIPIMIAIVLCWFIFLSFIFKLLSPYFVKIVLINNDDSSAPIVKDQFYEEMKQKQNVFNDKLNTGL